ncbi:MAG TPA: transketolase C-terminal domain-containing protein [Gemmataceae bacterium]|jgi:transketolase|nr:transketolase C-terminal domain-containing protein [Gemmataceae bacterium]
MRTAFANALIRAAQDDKRVVLLTGDHGYSLFDEFRRACPAQYLNAGVAEQNMVGVAAGLAKGGLRPVVYGLSSFVPIRVLEQIKLDVCYEELPVIFIGDGAGVVYSTLGSSHQSTEDVAALRALPHMSILSPADAAEMAACMKLALGTAGPVYLRMGKADLGPVHQAVPEIQWGDLCRLRSGVGPLGWIATGSMVKPSLEAARHWPESSVWSAPSLKPLHADVVAEICRQHQAIVVLEEHSIHGGLGSAIAEIAAEYAPTWICRIGVADRFSRYCGSYQCLLTEHGLNTEAIIHRVTAFLARTSRSTLAAA